MMRAKNLPQIFANTIVLVSLMLSSAGSVTPVRAAPVAAQAAFAPGVVLVGLKTGVSLQAREVAPGGRTRPYISSSNTLASKLDALAVKSVRPLLAASPVTALGASAETENPLARVYRLQLPVNGNVENAVGSLAGLAEVAFAEPDYLASALDVPAFNRPTPMLAVADPLYADQWGLAKINIESAWAVTQGQPTVIIAIVDSGIDLSHADLASKLWVNPGEIAGNGLDDDSNGLVDDTGGWNFVSENNDVLDDFGHGTQVAGIAAAAANSDGIIGVCPLCKLMPVKVMQASGVSNYSDISAGVLYAAQKGARIINLSLGGNTNSNTLRLAVEAAANTYGAVVVAGAGNDNQNKEFYPAAYPVVLAVAGSVANDSKSTVSNYGSWVDATAPAEAIRTSNLDGDWVDASGTSMAAPFASGLAGLLASQHPDWTQATIRSQIVHANTNIDAANPGLEGLLGSGRLDAGQAVQTPKPLLVITGYQLNGVANGRPLLGGTAQLNVNLRNDWLAAKSVTGTLSTSDTNVTIGTSVASFGDIASSATKTNATAFTFTVAKSAGADHAIPFTLSLSATGGYSVLLNFTVSTASGIVTPSGTLLTQTWTSDNIYLIKSNIGVPPGETLTIEPGTVVKFDGNYSISIGGTLLADGDAGAPIQFRPNAAGTWGEIAFTDTSHDAQADGGGVYLSGSILRNAILTGSTGGITCVTATPYLANLNTDSGGVTCSLGATPAWFLDNTIGGNVNLSGAGTANRNNVTGALAISGAGTADDNKVTGALSLGSGAAHRNTVGGLSVGGNAGTLQDNVVSANVSVGDAFLVLGNTISGSLAAGSDATIQKNTVSNGITVGANAVVSGNNVENAAGSGLSAGVNLTASYNRLVGNQLGMSASTGLIEHNLVANSRGVGLQVGAATVQYNTFTGNKGNTILVKGGVPVAIQYNNLEGNSGGYDLYIDVTGSTIPVDSNWWGSTDTTVIETRIYDYWDGDYTKAQASYSPSLSSPEQIAPGYVRSIQASSDVLGIETGTFTVQFSRPMDTTVTPSLSFGRGQTYEAGSPFQWSAGASMPQPRRHLGVAVGGNGKIYAIGGIDSSRVARVDEYNPETNTWTARASMPTIRSGMGVTTGKNGNIYAIGGDDPSGNLATVEEYNPLTNSWRARSPMPTARRGLDIATAVDGKIYAVGGYGNDPIGTVEVYDPASDTWATLASMPTQRYSLNLVAANNGFLYAIGGGYYYDALATVEKYDPKTNLWTTCASMPTARMSMSATLLPDGKIIVVGGWDGSGSVNNVEVYDPILNTWSTGASLLKPRYAHGVVNWKDSKIYVVGGAQYPGSEIAEIEEASISVPVVDGFYNSNWSVSDQYQASYDFNSSIPRGTYHIYLNNAIDDPKTGMLIAPFSDSTFVVDYGGAITDRTPPLKPVVSVNGNATLTTLSASWKSSDTESAIDKYRYAIGTTPGARNIVDWTYVPATTLAVTRTNLKLVAGQVYYVSVGARNVGGLWSLSGVGNGIKAGTALPGVFNKVGPATAAVVYATPTISWTASSGVSSYEYCYATTAAACTNWTTNGALTSKLLSGLAPGKTYFWQVRAKNMGGLSYANNSAVSFWSFKYMATSTISSTPAEDGWLLEISENGNMGGAFNTTQSLQVGDDAANKQYRSLLSFNTAGLPDNAVIVKVTLKIKKSALVGTNPFSTHGLLLADIKKGFFGASAGLSVADFQVAPSLAGAGSFVAVTGAAGWYQAVLKAAAYPSVNKTGLTQFRLAFAKDDDNDRLADYLKFFSGEALLTNRPVLVIEYTVP
jgi:subtilisin family serine protease